MDSPELRALREESQGVDATLERVPRDGWAGKGLGSWTLAELVAHLVRGVTRLGDYIDQPVDPATPLKDRVAYFRYDHTAQAPGVASRAVEAAAGVDAETLPALFAEGWRAAAELAAELPAEQVMATFFGPMTLNEYVATRVLEVTIHHLDLRAALDLSPAPTADAGRLSMELLEGLLGAPRPRNLGRVRFLLAATGRIPTDDPRLPVLR